MLSSAPLSLPHLPTVPLTPDLADLTGTLCLGEGEDTSGM